MIKINHENKCGFCIHGTRDEDYMFCQTCENKCNFCEAKYIALFSSININGQPFIVPLVEDDKKILNDIIESMIEISDNKNISIYHIK